MSPIWCSDREKKEMSVDRVRRRSRQVLTVRSELLGFGVETDLHARDLVDHEQKAVGHDEAPGADGNNTEQLLEGLHPVAVHPAAGNRVASELGDSGVGEDAGEESADDTADSVESEAEMLEKESGKKLRGHRKGSETHVSRASSMKIRGRAK
jgi:hypothetical protein